MKKQDLSRRGFLRVTVAVGAVGATLSGLEAGRDGEATDSGGAASEPGDVVASPAPRPILPVDHAPPEN